MATNKWKKTENEAGYPIYIDDATGKQQYDHPQFQKIMESLEEYDGIKYSAYQIAFKILALQKELRVPPLRISSGVFARHQLSLSESSLSLDTAELEAVLADIYFAAEKEGLFTGDVDLAVDLLINLLLNVYDKEREKPIRVLAAKTLLIILSEECLADKWAALANCSADHNGCVSPRRLAALLTHVTALATELGSQCDDLQVDVESCFDKSAGMLGISARGVASWGAQHCSSARWLALLQHCGGGAGSAVAWAACAACGQPLRSMLKFKCSKCHEVYFCEKCYLYDKELTAAPGHKASHLVQEIVGGETPPAECIGFIRSMRRFFFCTKTKKKKTSQKNSVKSTEKASLSTAKRRKENKPAMFTSTVGKASGHAASNPAAVLHDIIMQLETQNKALKELSIQLEAAPAESDDGLRAKVDAHYGQISTQISRLKVVKENLARNPEIAPTDTKLDKAERPQAFDLFSPIPIEDKQSKVTEPLPNPPRVLSLDSGNFSAASQAAPAHASRDSISTVSMHDISSWYNETQPTAPDKPAATDAHTRMSQSISATEQQFAADIRSVATSNDKMRELNADLDTVLDRLQQILSNNFAVDDSCFDNSQLRDTANEMEGLLGSLIRGVEQRATLSATKGLV